MSCAGGRPRHHAFSHPFDAATAVVRTEEGWVGEIGRAYWGGRAPFGGATAATILRAVLDHPQRRGDPLALTVNFCAPIELGPLSVHPWLTQANRSTQHWSATLRQGDKCAATASVVTADRKPSWSHQAARMPQASPSDALPVHVREGPPWIAQYEFRFASGEPASARSDAALGGARSVAWMCDRPRRPLDALSLTALSDAFFGRLVHVRGQASRAGTVSLTTHFHVGADALAAEDAGQVLGVADGRVFHEGYSDQTGELWSPSGRLLATTSQVAFYRT